MPKTMHQTVYLVAAIVGAIATWTFNIIFMQEMGGFSVTDFVTASYANAASSSISNDLLVVVFTALFWSFFEARRLAMRNWWLYVVLTFTIAIAFAFPLFMFMRERRLAELAAAGQDLNGAVHAG